MSNEMENITNNENEYGRIALWIMKRNIMK